MPPSPTDYPDDIVMEAYGAALGVARRRIPASRWDRENIVSDALLGAAIALRRHDPARGPISAYACLVAEHSIIAGFRERSSAGRGGMSDREQRARIDPDTRPPWRRTAMRLADVRDAEAFLLDPHPQCHDPAYDVARRVDLGRSMAPLSDAERTAVVLTMLGFSQTEAGALLGVPRWAIKDAIRTAYHKMRPLLVGHEAQAAA